MKYNLIKGTLIILIIFAFPFYSGHSRLNSPININILMPAPFAESTSNIINQFNLEQKGNIHINLTKGPRETEAVSDLAISSLLLGKSPFDIILMDVTWLPKYAEAGWLEPMNEWFSPDEMSSLSSGARLGNTYKENIYRWPLTADMGLLYWRTDLMKEAPRTPDELIQISINLKEKGLVPYGYVWQGHQYEGLSCVFLEILKGFGGEWLDDSQNVGLGSEQAIEAANWLRKLIDTGASPKSVANFTENEVLQAFESGDAALMRNWPYAWSEVQKDNSPVKGKVGISRMVSKENQEPFSTLGSWGFSVLKDSQNKQAAYKVIKYLTSSESQKQLLLNSGYTPTNASLYKDKELQKKVPILRELEVALNSTQPRPQTPLYAQISDVLQKHLSSILTENTVVVKDKMNSATDKTLRILKSAGKT